MNERFRDVAAEEPEVSAKHFLDEYQTFLTGILEEVLDPIEIAGLQDDIQHCLKIKDALNQGELGLVIGYLEEISREVFANHAVGQEEMRSDGEMTDEMDSRFTINQIDAIVAGLKSKISTA